MKRKAVVLLSGGLDSAVALYFAKDRGYECRCLNFDYGQRHRTEMKAAASLARRADVKLQTVRLDLPWKGSSLLDTKMRVPRGRKPSTIKKSGIPSTYVPARNTVFLSIAASCAEATGSSDIFIGAHTEDSSGYPDCRPGYLKSFDGVIRQGTKAGLEGRLRLQFPLIELNKAGIIRLGHALGVPFEHTWSCYAGGDTICGECDSCVLRSKGFREAGLEDPLDRIHRK